jgi:hypothetical protein
VRKLLLVLVAAFLPLLTSASWAGEDLTSMTNADRTAAGLAALTTAPDLQSFAQRRAEEMARANKLWHTSNLGTQITNWQRVGENVGRGPSLRDIQTAFMNSPSHRENILHRAFTQIGTGVASDGGQLLYVAVIFRQPKTTTTTAAPAPTTAPAPSPAPKPRPKPVAAAAPAPTTTTTTAPPPPAPEPAPVVEAPPPPPPPVEEPLHPFATPLVGQRSFEAANAWDADVPPPTPDASRVHPVMAGTALGLVGLCGGGLRVRLRRRLPKAGLL